MSLTLYNTLTRQKEPFKPHKTGQASLYTCGPTVYDAAHIGNLRTYVWEDVLRRWLEHGHGLKVTQVMNITDVEDKIIAGSQAKTVKDMRAYTKPFERQFFADLAMLGVEPAEQYPHATEAIPQIIALIEQILAAGYAYERGGSVYFDVQKYHQDHRYGRLLNIDFEGFAEGQRIDNDEYDKESAQDFALWKAAPKDSPGWKSPWGREKWGRPGWHVECSAMAGAKLDGAADIHAGAVDLIFPHHENEIAQTKAATGQPLARYWLHAEHLLVDNAKMAKSAGNYYTLTDIAARGYRPQSLRLLFLQAHYRSTLNFTWPSLDAAATSLQRIQEFYNRLAVPVDAAKEDPEAVAVLLAAARKRFAAALDDDLNTAEALAAVFDLVRSANALIDSGKLDENDLGAVLAALTEFNDVLGVFEFAPVEVAVPAAVTKLVAEREAARESDDFAAADTLRKKIAKAGFTVEDTPNGPRLRKK